MEEADFFICSQLYEESEDEEVVLILLKEHQMFEAMKFDRRILS